MFTAFRYAIRIDSSIRLRELIRTDSFLDKKA